MSDGSTTNRVERLGGDSASVENGVDRLSPTSNPRGDDLETGSRERQKQAKREIAEKLDIDREGVGSVARLNELDVFLRSGGQREFGDEVASEFASEADFVKASDIAPNVDGDEISASPVVATGRRDDVAARARQQTASDTQFITAADLDADVGKRGVSSIFIAEKRRDDVASRTRQSLAADREFAKASDFGVDVGERGIESASLTDIGQRRVAARQLETESPLGDIAPREDLTESGDGFALDTDAKRRSAARGFEDDLEVFEQGELSPDEDLRDTDSGFGLAREEAKIVAADRIDEDLPDIDVEPDDITLEKTDSGEFDASFEQEVRR